ncbi:ATP-grasp domain-containing protein [Actinopolyspora mortivallis]|uniref:ATP-grasp domain-containing protein n=1 Tax=Actinopolyspora mortivallis TaxID=33906 RepID=UPI0015E602EA|nr:ATP-grasp domain-containing protein [Actinopolyspora mortivallis]
MFESGASHTERPLLLLVNAMDQQTRGHLLESVARNHRVWLFTDQPPEWERPYVLGHTVVDTLDPHMMITAARPLRPDAVVCWDETRVLPVAHVARALGLAGIDPDVIRTCRDKHLTREAVDAAGGPQPTSTAVSTLAEARAAAERTGYPVVVKPRAMVGSTGVGLARSRSELDTLFPTTQSLTMEEVRERFTDPVLVEEYLDGPEISVDTLVWDDEIDPLYVARKELSPPPNFEEIGHSVDRADPILEDTELREALALVHKAVGLTRAWTHSEWRLTSRGPRLVEINARSGGDFISYLGLLTTGIDAGLAAAELALGHRPVPGTANHEAAAVRFLYPEVETVVGRITIDHDRLPPAIKVARVLAQPGHVLELPPASHTGRYAMLVAVGGSAAECRSALDAAEEAVLLEPAEQVRR